MCWYCQCYYIDRIYIQIKCLFHEIIVILWINYFVCLPHLPLFFLSHHYDIICLQELWLDKSELDYLNTFNSQFGGYGVSPVDPCNNIIRGRKFGGAGFLWSKQLEKHIKPVKFDYDWLSCLEINMDNHKCYLINVYLPYESSLKEDEYISCLGVVESIIHELPSSHIFIVGDYNTDHRRKSSLTDHLNDFQWITI